MKAESGMRKVAVLLCVSMAILFPLSGFQPLGAQCGVKVKQADMAAYKEAVDLHRHKRYTEAGQKMRKVAGRNPKAADPQYWLGMNGVRNGFNTAAIRKHFTRCIELCPNYPNAVAHYYMAVIHYTDRRYDEAVAELNTYFQMAAGTNDPEVLSVYDEASNYLYWCEFLGEAELNKAPFEPRLVQGVSSERDEMLPFLAHDGQTFYYLRNVPVRRERTFYARQLEETHWQLYSSRLIDSLFSAGAPLPSPFNSGDPEGGVSVTADGNELYFSIIHTEKGYANSDIYCARRKEGRWQKPAACSRQVNGERSWESQPTVSPDGQTLVFASNRAGGHGGTDLWRCHRLPNGDWSRAENLGDNVNTVADERFPFLAADGHTLYFISNGWQGFGGFDFYFTNLLDVGGNRPTNLGLPINTEGDELSFGVTPDGHKAYYSGRTDSSRSADIVMFDLYPAARPEPMRLCRIDVLDRTGQPLRFEARLASGAVYRGEGQLCIMLSMRYDNLLTIYADSAGLLPEMLMLTASDVARGRMGEGVTLVPAEVGSVVPLTVNFLSGSRLADDAEQLLDAYAAFLLANPRMHVAVECPKYTDAKAIYNYFVGKKKLRAERFSIESGSGVARPQMRVTANQ
jgi:hypothetical protein